MERIRLYTDGGSRGNPGPAAVGAVVCDGEDRVIREAGRAIGRATNNEAEYRALILGLDLAADLSATEVTCVLDSELVVRQLTGTYAVREGRMADLVRLVREREARFRKVTFEHRPRLSGHLRRADGLVNEALDAAGEAGSTSSP